MASPCERVLITGGDGFTGIALAQALRADGHDVIIHGRDSGAGDVSADLAFGEPIARLIDDVQPSAIVHLAAISFPAHGDLHSLYTINVSGSAALLQAAAQSKRRPNSVILASSAKVYAPPQSDAPLMESAPLGGSDHYGLSKLMMEQIARMFSAELPITIVRPFNYTGPGQDERFFVPKMVRAFVSGTDVTVGNLDVARDFSDIVTVVEAYRRLVAAPKPGGVFNICSGAPVPLKDILQMLRDVTGNAIEVNVSPALMRGAEPPVIVGSSAALERAVGALPRPTLRQTLERMAAAA